MFKISNADFSQFTTIRNFSPNKQFVKNDVILILTDAFSCTPFGGIQTSGVCCNDLELCTVTYQVFLSYLRMHV